MKLSVPVTTVLAASALAMAIPGSLPRTAVPALPPLPGIETATVEPGRFVLRLPGEYLRHGRPVDAPLREIAFERSFDMMKYQVTVEEYGRCVAEGACQPAEGKPAASGTLPVTGVSYRDATAYAGWLSARTGQTWRLPTDEEWAFAAAERFSDDALRFDGGDGDPAARWIARYRAEAEGGERDPLPKPQGHFGMNTKGLFDLAGNIWEWTSTCYTRATIGTDGTVVSTTENCGVRVTDGRHRGYMSNFIRDGKSGGCAAGIAPDNLGFRLVREPASLLSKAREVWQAAQKKLQRDRA